MGGIWDREVWAWGVGWGRKKVEKARWVSRGCGVGWRFGM